MKTVNITKWVGRAMKGAILGLIILYFYGLPLPRQGEIDPAVIFDSPRQEEIVGGIPFTKDYLDLHYEFTPLASYEITGLVVSLHQSDSIIDISHEFDPANTTDVCVVWGKNISSGGYKQVTYDHGDFTCTYRWEGDIPTDFRPDQLSNSHLIPTTYPDVKTLKSLQVGDQIRMTGTLVDYEVAKNNGTKVGNRRTSLTRLDAGNGACEIIYLSGVQILKRNMPWRTPVQYILITILLLGFIYSLYSIVPKKKTPIGILSGKPHVENPFDIKNFIKRK